MAKSPPDMAGIAKHFNQGNTSVQFKDSTGEKKPTRATFVDHNQSAPAPQQKRKVTIPPPPKSNPRNTAPKPFVQGPLETLPEAPESVSDDMGGYSPEFIAQMQANVAEAKGQNDMPKVGFGLPDDTPQVRSFQHEIGQEDQGNNDLFIDTFKHVGQKLPYIELETIAHSFNYVKTGNTNKKVDERFLPLAMPSGCAPYDVERIMVRTLNLTDLINMHFAHQQKQESALLDVLNNCISIDIRELTVGDFWYFVYWLRLASFPRTPFSIKWRSRYGNECEFEVNKTSIENKVLELTRGQYREWNNLGYDIPRIKDWEILLDTDLTMEQRWIYERAQYYRGKTPVEKVAAFNAIGFKEWPTCQEWQKKIVHGVQESVEVTDPHFDPEKWLAQLEERADGIRVFILRLEEMQDAEGSLQATRILADLDQEIATLKKQIEEGEVRPEPDKVFPEIGVAEFLSALQLSNNPSEG